MPTTEHRRDRGRVLATLLLLLFPSLVPMHGSSPAHAQESPTVSMELLSQSATLGPDDERFAVRVLAQNDGAARVGELDVRLVVGSAFVSRSDYERSLAEGPSDGLAVARFPFVGGIEPGGVREFAVSVDPATITPLSEVDSGVYPLQVQVRSAGATVGALNTSIVWILREPTQPLSFSWWTVVDAPLPLDPDGFLVDPAFEVSIGDDGTLHAQAEALAQLVELAPGVPIDVIVRPALLEQLTRMSDGYQLPDGTRIEAGTGGAQDAADLLETLSRAAADEAVQVSAMPFAGPSIPALLAGDLQVDLEAQRKLGNDWTDRALGVDPAVAVARTPGGLLSDETLAWLAGKGTRTILADVDTVERPLQEKEFAPPSTATVSSARGDVTLVLPDPGTQALLTREDLLADPVRGAQAVLGELGVIWREVPVPVPPTQRGLALQLPTDMPVGMWEPLVRRLASAPFLAPAHAQDHVDAVVPKGERTVLRSPSTAVFSEGYADDIRQLRRDVDAFASMFVEPSPQPARLRRDLYVSESLPYLGDEPAGQAWLDHVGEVTATAFEVVTPTSQVFTLTSREGDIPLRMNDPGPEPLRVTVELRSSGFEFPEGNRQEVELEPGSQRVVTFAVVSKSVGQHDIQVLVEAPSGRVVSDRVVTVRSTALNAIALAVTGAAALVLVALWVRRWFRRRTA